MDVPALERRLQEAKKRFEEACKAIAPVHKGGEWEEFRAAQSVLLTVERELAEAKGEEYAVPLDFPVQWDTGAPLPLLITSAHKTFLLFHVRADDPNWDGTYINPSCGSGHC